MYVCCFTLVVVVVVATTSGVVHANDFREMKIYAPILRVGKIVKNAFILARKNLVVVVV